MNLTRRQFISTTAAVGGVAAAPTERLAAIPRDGVGAPQGGGSPASRGVYVPRGKDRFERTLKIWGAIPLEVKVSTADSRGALFVFEHAGMPKGGPPRHFHHEQDEWFYAVEGEFAFEVGDERFTLRPGDSLFGPRRVPHVWAYVGSGPGTLLLAVQPAGSLEAFFRENAAKTGLPTPEEAARSFAAHGMQVVGPPLEV